MMPRKRITTNIVITIPATRTKAYFFGRPSCLNLANGNVASVSKKIIQQTQVMYSACLPSSPARLAMSDLNIQRQRVKIIVVKKIEKDKVLYKCFRSSD